MKEININIEGYNVNGICVGCLNYNRKMFYSDEVKECFLLLGNIDVPDGLSIQVCWECLAYVKKVMAFKEQILRSYDVLIAYSKRSTFLNSPKHFTSNATQRLFQTNIDSKSTVVMQDKDEVKSEEEEILDEVKDEIEVHDVIKPEEDINFDADEQDTLKMESTYFDDSHFSEDIPSQEQDATSEDDIKLSKLKERTNKKKKKKKESKSTKSSKENRPRKLKNLPEDLVELYNMTEKEMWEVRSDDVKNAGFIKLKYKCEDCIIGFNTEKLMKDHIAGKHNPKSDDCRQCDVCKAYFLTKDNVSSHRLLHMTAYKCKQCGYRCSIKRLMLDHIQTHGGTVEDHKCNSCGAIFSTKSKLSYHRTVCKQERPQCDCCGKVFANKITLKYHLKILPQKKDDKPKEKLFLPCKGCGKVFHSKKSYRAHVVIHNGQTYPCPICGKRFHWKRNLARHTRNHRERDAGVPHECRACGKTFSSRDCYNNHMRLSRRHANAGSFNHECSYCGKRFPTKWCMVDHVDWDHLKKVKYQCNVCYKAFKTAKIMVAHINNIHEGKKRDAEPEGEHLCDICGKSYKTVKRLKGHVWAMHTMRSTTKSFKCKLCPATFTWQTSIYKHVKMMHDLKPKHTSKPTKLKQEPYPEIEMTNRIQYFQHNLAQNVVQTGHNIQPASVAGIMQNIA